MEILRVLPKNLLSRTVGELVSLERPKILATTIRDWFAARYRLNMDEAEHPIDHYPSMAKLFTRKLKPGVRPIGEGVEHPCDAVLTQVETIQSDSLLQAKGKTYSIQTLLGISSASAEAKTVSAQVSKGADTADTRSAISAADPISFRGGTALTYYLCPTDYHRVHSPMDLELQELVHVPGTLWPVNAWSVGKIQSLFTANERLIFRFQSSHGPVALVMVGATNVGKITATHAPEVATNIRRYFGLPLGRAHSQNNTAVNKPKIERRIFQSPIQIKKGEEIGVFNLGSTVVALYGPGIIASAPQPGKVQLGESCCKPS